MNKKTDIIVIGGGPNGLTAGAYLSKAGLKVTVMDCNQELGGGLATEMVTFPGFMSNTHAIYHMMVDFAPIFDDLELETKYNVNFAWPELQFCMLYPDGKSLCLYRDVESTCRSIAEFSRKDAESYRRMHKKFKAYMDYFTGPLTYMPAMGALEQIPMLEMTELGREFVADSDKSAQELIEEYFENDCVRSLFYYCGCYWGLEYDCTGLGFLAMLNMDRASNYRLCVGGSHRLASALQKVILENGGKLLGSQWIKKIIVKDGAAKGVELEDGTVIEAEKGVISTIDLDTTFVKYVGSNNLTRDFVESIGTWEWEKWSLLHLHFALDEPPAFKAAEANPDINKALVYILGYQGSRDLFNQWEGIGRGERQVAGFQCSFPSVHDPSQAPPGKCTGLISQMAAYDLKEGAKTWERYKFKKELFNQRMEILRQYAPNMTKDKILAGYVETPVGIERRFPDMVKGSIKQGRYSALQLGYNRPNADCSNHRTPVKNLWLGGANTYPGGLAIFGSGYLAANAVAEDLNLAKWWPEPQSVVNAKAAGTLT